LKKLRGRREHLAEAAHSRQEEAKNQDKIERIAVAFEAAVTWGGWLRARDIEAYIIHASSVAVSREHRPRQDRTRLDTELPQTRLSGWLRGERDHCRMVAIPTSRTKMPNDPNRERESLVGEQSRIVNRMKAALVRLGIRGFNPKLRRPSERLDGLRTPEGEPIPPTRWLSCVATWRADGSVSDQIRHDRGYSP